MPVMADLDCKGTLMAWRERRGNSISTGMSIGVGGSENCPIRQCSANIREHSVDRWVIWNEPK